MVEATHLAYDLSTWSGPMRRLVVLPLAALVLATAVACGSSDDGAIETLPPLRTTSTLATTSTTTDPRDVVYIVQSGDSVSEIARSYQVTARMIVEFNDLPDNGETIQPGQELLIPPVLVVRTLPTPETTAEP